MTYKIRPRAGSAAEWTAANPVLAEREIGYEFPADGLGAGYVKMKMGDGVTHWNDLPYASEIVPISNGLVQDAVDNWFDTHGDLLIPDGAITEPKLANALATKINNKADTSALASETLARQNADTALSNQIAALQGAVGSPLLASTVDGMTDTTKIYVYTGSETGYTSGDWYYYNGSSWVSGGVYNAVAVNTDTTLSVSGMPADAKVVGDEFSHITESTNLFGNTAEEIIESTINGSGYLIFGSSGRVVIIECQPDTLYRVSKNAGGRFIVGDLDHYPADRDLCKKYYVDNTASTIYYTTSNSAKYLVAFVYYNATDGSNYSTMLASVNIQLVSAKDVVARQDLDKKVDALYGYESIVETSYNDGVITYLGNTTTGSSFKHCVFNVEGGKTYKVYTPQVFNQPSFPVYLFYNSSNNIILYGPSSDDVTVGLPYTGEVKAPSNATKAIVNCNSSAKGTISEKYKLDLQGSIDEAIESYSPYADKTIIFFGTSIIMPSAHSIPTYIGDILGCNIVNQAKGSSCARRGWDNKISANDSYGWTGVAWQNVFRAMGANLTEKQDLIDNYESKWRDLIAGNSDGSDGDSSGNAKPNTLSASDIAEIQACSYENLLMPYLDGTYDMPDLFVFEHGRNDVNSWYSGNDSDFVGTVANESSLNRSKYGDVMYFYIQKIFEANPQAKVLIMSYYEHDSAKGAVIVPAQKQLAEYHGVYFCDVSNAVAWTQRKITTTGYWGDDHIWVNSGGASQTITRKQQALYDNLHPHSDYSGDASMRVAQIVAKYIESHIML